MQPCTNGLEHCILSDYYCTVQTCMIIHDAITAPEPRSMLSNGLPLRKVESVSLARRYRSAIVRVLVAKRSVRPGAPGTPAAHEH